MVLLKRLNFFILLLCFINSTFSGCVYTNKEIASETELPTIESPNTKTSNIKSPDTQISNSKGRLKKENHNIVYSNIGDAAKAYPGLVFIHGKPYKKQVALTFDDGPDNCYTPQILDLLNLEKVKATFFVVGEQVKENPMVMKRIVSEGHFIGNHTWAHPYLPNLTIDDAKSEVQRTEDEIAQYTGYQTTMFRPPYGVITSDIVNTLSGLNYKIIEWSSDSIDWRGYKKDQVKSNILNDTKAGAIILQHCAGAGKLEGTVQALPLVIETLKKEGYTFVTVPELLGLPGEKTSEAGLAPMQVELDVQQLLRHYHSRPLASDIN